MSHAKDQRAQSAAEISALEIAENLPKNVVPATPGQDNTALVLGSTLTMNRSLRGVLANDDMEPAVQRAHVAKYRELMSQMTGMDVESGLQAVIQQLTVLNNTMDGIALFEELEEADLLDYKNPMVIFGLMLFASKESVNHQVRNMVLERVLENLSVNDIASLLNKLESTEGLSEKKKNTLVKSFSRVLTNSALENTGVDFEDGNKFRIRHLMDINYEDMLGSSDTDDPLVKVLSALSIADSDLEEEILEDIRVAVKKYRKTLERIKDDKKHSAVSPHIPVSNEFNRLLTQLLPIKLKRLKSQSDLALTAIQQASPERAALTAGSQPDVVANGVAADANKIVDEANLDI